MSFSMSLVYSWAASAGLIIALIQSSRSSGVDAWRTNIFPFWVTTLKRFTRALFFTVTSIIEKGEENKNTAIKLQFLEQVDRKSNKTSCMYVFFVVLTAQKKKILCSSHFPLCAQMLEETGVFLEDMLLFKFNPTK